jgi:hypothetical protein
MIFLMVEKKERRVGYFCVKELKSYSTLTPMKIHTFKIP